VHCRTNQAGSASGQTPAAPRGAKRSLLDCATGASSGVRPGRLVRSGGPLVAGAPLVEKTLPDPEGVQNYLACRSQRAGHSAGCGGGAGDRVDERKLQAPNSKIQRNTKLQVSKF